MNLLEDIGSAGTAISVGLSLASDVPAAITFIEGELPNVEGEVKSAYEAVLTPAKSIAADVTLTVKGGTASVITADAQKTVADVGAFITAVEALIPQVESEAESEYAKLLPILQPIASALKINLPQLQTAATTAAGAAA